MRSLLLIAVVSLALSGGAVAQDTMGITIVEDDIIEGGWVPGNGPFDAYIYLMPQVAFVGGYETSITFEPFIALILTASGPNGWTNFGDNANHLVGFVTPLPVSGEFVVLSTLNILILDPATFFYILLGPSSPSSFDPPAPGYADGITPDDLYPCEGRWAIMNEVLATESRTLGEVKALFR